MGNNLIRQGKIPENPPPNLRRETLFCLHFKRRISSKQADAVLMRGKGIPGNCQGEKEKILFQTLLYKMNLGIVPIFCENSGVIAVQVQLVQSEGDGKVLGLPCSS